MFSSINEAWNNNPVKEITNKLTAGSFNKTQPDHTNIYNFKSNLSDLSDPSAASDSGINLLSEDMSVGQNMQTSFRSYSPVKFKSKSKSKSMPKSKSKSILKPAPISSVDFSEFETSGPTDTTPANAFDSRCSYSVKHLDKCARCTAQLNKLINKKVKEKINDIFLDINMTQLKMNNINQPPPQVAPPTTISDSWKETLIIMVGAVIAIFIIFLITKSFNK